MSRTKLASRFGVRASLRGGPLVALAVWLGAAPACPAGDCGHCPPPYVHCQEQPPRIKFKCVCPKPVCAPCDQEFWGYYPTCWRRWPAPYANCPDRNPPWVGAPPGALPSAVLPSPGAQTMPPADEVGPGSGGLGMGPAQMGKVSHPTVPPVPGSGPETAAGVPGWIRFD
jgi:hypothetical protein